MSLLVHSRYEVKIECDECCNMRLRGCLVTVLDQPFLRIVLLRLDKLSFHPDKVCSTKYECEPATQLLRGKRTTTLLPRVLCDKWPIQIITRDLEISSDPSLQNTFWVVCRMYPRSRCRNSFAIQTWRKHSFMQQLGWVSWQNSTIQYLLTF